MVPDEPRSDVSSVYCFTELALEKLQRVDENSQTVNRGEGADLTAMTRNVE